jgi:indolepyruvate ferredoxin oxidoreductase
MRTTGREAPPEAGRPGPVSLDDVYAEAGPDGPGRALMSGIQAIVRLILDQRRLDRRRGLDTAGFVSGYEGSPLGGLDIELGRASVHLAAEGVVFQPGLNEELAATAVAGTQLLADVPGHRHEGVTGWWYGKNPGLDRAADAIRHGNYAGTAELGGAVALIGDDPACKSSTLPSSSWAMAKSLCLPLLAPGTVADVVRLGRHAVALSRSTGLWAGLQIVAEVADGSAVVDLAAMDEPVVGPTTARPEKTRLMVGATALEAEADLFSVRLPAVLQYARAAGLTSVVADAPTPRLAVVASGTAFSALRRAVEDLGLWGPAGAELGLRLIRVDLPWPLDGDELARLTAGLDEVLVVEDKAPFIESQLKEFLYGRTGAPAINGKSDPEGRELIPMTGTVSSDMVALALARRLGEDRLPPSARRRLSELSAGPRRRLRLAPLPSRTPYFCSGCPHNISTRASDDQLVGLGIGCHIMAAFDEHGRGHHLGITQMGGEGAQWIGMAPFAEGRSFVQNLGDGTFFHSGSLAVRAAVAAGVDITYRLLYNGAVAMTGGQEPLGQMPVPELTRLLATEGVRKVVVTTPDPDHYRGVALDPIAEVRHRDDLTEVMAELEKLGGVTVVIHDDRCAAEERRERHRGKLAEPPDRVWINERVCEGCGDCGEQSTCLSVVPVETEFGHKTRIHQGSCNHDRSCLKGDCPSFVLVTPARRRRHRRRHGRRSDAGAPPSAPVDLPAPPVDLVDPDPLRVGTDSLVRLPGIGGTGVVTVSRIVQMAAHLDGLYAAGLDQTGLAQKGGPVISDVRISDRPVEGTVRAGTKSVDLLLGLDLLGAANEETLSTCDSTRTVAVVNTAEVATAAMVLDPAIGFPHDVSRIDRTTRQSENLYLDAQRISERLFADHLPTNMVMLGAAVQHGCLPITPGAVERAIELNGAAVGMNRAAFRWGRAAALDPDAVRTALAPSLPAPPAAPSALERLLDSAPPAVAPVLARRAADLAGWQSIRVARRYVEDVLAVAREETERTGDAAHPVAIAYAAGLHKLWAYKDEYEVARLHLDPAQRAALEAEFGPGAHTQVLLRPPLLVTFGLRRKIRVGRIARPVFVALRAARHLRGTPFDPFGRTAMRRTERALVGEYRRAVRESVEQLRPENAATVAALAGSAEEVRGYENVKRRGIERFRGRLAERGTALSEPPAPVGHLRAHWPIAR